MSNREIISIAQNNNLPLPKGVQQITNLPDPGLRALWDSIIVPDKLKTRLLGQAVLNFSMRGKVPRDVIPLHGVILLTGLPGTGKTSLARGLASRTAQAFKLKGFKLLEIDPHALASSALGKSQRAVTELFAQTIAEAAANGPTIVLLDEVETLAADRSKLSLEANPIDVHRATDAVLVQLDLLAEVYPSLLFLATSNFPGAIDNAFKSRCDLVIEVSLPDRGACKKILSDCLSGMAKIFPNIGDLIRSSKFSECANKCVGLDGRTIRKMVSNALSYDMATALDPNKLTVESLMRAACDAKKERITEA